jgi:micrococcal nuclease
MQLILNILYLLIFREYSIQQVLPTEMEKRMKFLQKRNINFSHISLMLCLAAVSQFSNQAWSSTSLSHSHGDGNISIAANAKCHASDWKGISHFTAQIAKGVDGDTVKIIYKKQQYNVRLLSIDTPETHFMGKSQGYWGDVAAEKLTSWLPVGTTVEVGIDAGNVCDRYGRMLGYIYKDGKNLNEEMLRECLAVMYCIYPSVDQCERFGNITTQCMREKKGIFSDAELEIPYEWRRVMSNRDYEKWLVNLETKKVYSPEQVSQVPVGKRIFFMKKSEIQDYLNQN